MALATVDGLRFSYTGGAPVLDGISLEIADGEHIALLGPSGSGKSTLLRSLAALVPHFHGGRFEGRVVVGGIDTREARPAELAGTVASVFQDPEDQIVMSKVANEVAFGLENIGVDPAEIWPRVEDALALVGAEHLAERATGELSGGELQRVSLASALALKPRLLLLDEPTSQLDPEAAEAFFDLVERLPCAVLVSEQRPARPLAHVDRVLFMDGGRIVLDAPRDDALAWLAEHRPLYLPHVPELMCSVRNVRFAYGDRVVLEGASLEVRRGEVVALTGPNGAGKTTLAQIAAGSARARGGGGHALACRLPRPGSRPASRDGARARRGRARCGRRARRMRRSRGSAWPSTSSGIRAISPPASASGSRSPPCSPPSRNCSCSTSRHAASTPSGRPSSRACCAPTPLVGGTLVVTHDLLWAAEVADRIVELDVRESVHA